MWESGFDTTGETFKWAQKLIKIRKQYTALRRGDSRCVVYHAHRRRGGLGHLRLPAQRRRHRHGYALVVFNTNQYKESHTGFEGNAMSVIAPARTVLVDVLNDAAASYTVSSDGRVDISLPPSSAMILVPQGDVVALDQVRFTVVAVRTHGLLKSFADTQVLRGIDLEIPDGCFAVLVGPSGCGKSTLLRCLAGLEQVSAGRIEFGDRDVTELPPRERRGHGLPVLRAVPPHDRAR